jgi:hypothetical protein
MNQNHKLTLDRKIAELERRVSQLKAVREALSDDLIADDIAEVFRGLGGDSDSPTRGNGKKRDIGKTARKLRGFFLERHNEWATVKEMVSVTRISVHSIRQTLYKTEVGMFDRQSQPGGRRESRFRLRADGGSPHETTKPSSP